MHANPVHSEATFEMLATLLISWMRGGCSIVMLSPLFPELHGWECMALSHLPPLNSRPQVSSTMNVLGNPDGNPSGIAEGASSYFCHTSMASVYMAAVASGWFEKFPDPPLGVLSRIDALLSLHDNTLVS